MRDSDTEIAKIKEYQDSDTVEAQLRNILEIYKDRIAEKITLEFECAIERSKFHGYAHYTPRDTFASLIFMRDKLDDDSCDVANQIETLKDDLNHRIKYTKDAKKDYVNGENDE